MHGNVIPPKGTVSALAKSAMEQPPAELRFAIGDRVQCNLGGWEPGSVRRLWYREQSWPVDQDRKSVV
jgi:hypothetical protein